MRIVLDLQGAQTSISRARGVGRYSLGFAKSLARRAGPHEVWIALNGLFPETIEPLRAAFDGLVPQERLLVWQTATPVADALPANRWRREIGECVREAFLAELKPDLVHVSSLFEGFADDAVTSVGAFDRVLPTAATLYDLIPLLYRQRYLADPAREAWYERKLTHLRRADLVLAISESSRQEGIACLNLPAERVVNVSAAADAQFRPVAVTDDQQDALRRRLALQRPFVMYTGGIDQRKNVEGLIGAYARLPVGVRARHQLAIVCSASRDESATLDQLARRNGLGSDELVVTGFVSETDLVALYNLCALFIFPSWHEGFGLPVLEALSCGAVTLAADAPGVREIVARPDALFDPHDADSIAARLHAGLTDPALRRDLERHARQQARIYSWDQTADRAWAAFAEQHERARSAGPIRLRAGPRRRPRLAYVSPLPPERSGIADYAADLLPELARHYEIEAIVEQPLVDDPWIRANIECRTVAWFEANVARYDRIVYNFGNSVFHSHMFALLERHPGIVVLHDFFLSGVIAHMDRHGFAPRAWQNALYASHGYRAAAEAAAGDSRAIWAYPANFAVLEQAAGVIVHSEYARDLARAWYGERYGSEWTTIPMPRKSPDLSLRARARAPLGLREHDFLVCCFGMMGPIKLDHRLVEAWSDSTLARDEDCHLAFLGETDAGGYGAACARAIARSSAAARIRCTGFLTATGYRHYLLAADAAVQLRDRTRGETSAAMLDCLAYGLPTIVNALGAAAELPADCVIGLPAEFSDAELTSALDSIRRDPAAARATGQRANRHIVAHHSPRAAADSYRDAIESMVPASRSTRSRRLANAVADLSRTGPMTSADLLGLARSIAGNAQCGLTGPRQWLVDISELVRRDAKSGIQRVVRAVMGAWLEKPPSGFRVEPVFCDPSGVYRYARQFTARLLGIDPAGFGDEVIDTSPGDTFVGLDLFLHLQSERRAGYARMRERGVRLFFVVYDLLLVQRPELFVDGGGDSFRAWLESLAAVGDGAICISRTVADDLAAWLDQVQPKRLRPLKIGWFHLAAGGATPVGSTQDATVRAALEGMRSRRSVVMVGTIEPRKAHAQALSAFDDLWRRNIDVNLVIAGRQGWMVEALARQLREHRERGRRLFWIESATDDDLHMLSQAASGVLLASEGEGFGLPIVEAASHQRPVLARDIPVFREVAGDHATYFSGLSSESLVTALEAWLASVADGSVPKSAGIRLLTWDDSAERLADIINQDRWYREWLDGVSATSSVAQRMVPGCSAGAPDGGAGSAPGLGAVAPGYRT